MKEQTRTDIAMRVLSSLLAMPRCELIAEANGAPLQQFIVEQSVKYADKLIAELNKPIQAEKSDEYIRGVEDTCKWLESHNIGPAEKAAGLEWQNDCPKTLATLIRANILGYKSPQELNKTAPSQDNCHDKMGELLKNR